MIRVACKKCGAKLKVKDELEGKTGKCPSCGAPVKIERAAPEPESAAPAIEPVAPKTEPAAPAATPQPAPADRDDSSAPIPFDSLEDDEAPPPIILPGGEVPGATGVDEPTGPPASGDDLHVSTQEPLELRDPDEDFHVPTHLDVHSHYLICDHKDVVARWQNDGKGWMIRLKDGFTRAATVSTEIPQFGKYVLVEIGVERKDDGLHLRNITPFQLKPQYALMKLTKGDDAILSAVIGAGEMNTRQKRHVKDLVKSKFLPHTWDALQWLLP